MSDFEILIFSHQLLETGPVVLELKLRISSSLLSGCSTNHCVRKEKDIRSFSHLTWFCQNHANIWVRFLFSKVSYSMSCDMPSQLHKLTGTSPCQNQSHSLPLRTEQVMTMCRGGGGGGKSPAEKIPLAVCSLQVDVLVVWMWMLSSIFSELAEERRGNKHNHQEQQAKYCKQNGGKSVMLTGREAKAI